MCMSSIVGSLRYIEDSLHQIFHLDCFHIRLIHRLQTLASLKPWFLLWAVSQLWQKHSQRNFLKKLVNLWWSSQQLPCTRLSCPGSLGLVKNCLSEGSHNSQSLLCSWSGSQVNLEILGSDNHRCGSLPFALLPSHGLAARACWRILWCSRKSSFFDFFLVRVLSLARMELTCNSLVRFKRYFPPPWWYLELEPGCQFFNAFSIPWTCFSTIGPFLFSIAIDFSPFLVCYPYFPFDLFSLIF